jgi:hypothetical protein
MLEGNEAQLTQGTGRRLLVARKGINTSMQNMGDRSVLNRAGTLKILFLRTSALTYPDQGSQV